MKKILFTKCGAVLCCILLAANMYGQNQTIRDGLRYILNDEGVRTATLIGVMNTKITEAVIPSIISIEVIPNGKSDYQVEIGTSAFLYCDNLTSVTITEGVTKIGDFAFTDCVALTHITIPTSINTIGEKAFEGTGWYENLPDGLIYINSMVYGYKGEMPENTALSIKEGTVSITQYAFGRCENLTSISLPASLKKIDEGAFNVCKNLTEITLPENIEFIGEVAFNQTGLKTLTIPPSVTYMGLGIHPQIIRFEGIIPPATTPKENISHYHTNRTFFVPYESFVAYCNTKLIPLGTDSHTAMSVKALEDNKDIYGVTTQIGDSDGWGEGAGKVTVNGMEKFTGIKAGEKIEISVVADTNIMVIDSIQINDKKPFKFIDRTSFTYTIESAAAMPYTIKVNFKDKRTVSIADHTINSIRVYPTNGTVIIENINEPAPVTILNLAGQTLYQGTTDSYAPVSLPSGIYLIKIGTQTHKIVMK